MKRLLSSASCEVPVLKHRCGQQQLLASDSNNETFLLLFFRALTPYEKLRLLYISKGVAQLQTEHHHHIVCNVATILARLSLCQDGFRRRYRKQDSPLLYAEVAQRYRTRCMQQVVQKAVALQQADNVPRHRLVVVCVNGGNKPEEECSDATLVHYVDGFPDLLARHTSSFDIVLPPITHYECLDVKQHELVRARLGWSRRRLKQEYERLGLIKTWWARISAKLINLILQLCGDIAAELFY